MEAYTQLGISGVTLGILFFIVRYFISAMDKKDSIIIDQYKALRELTERSILSIDKVSNTIEINTNATKTAAEVTKLSANNLTKLMLKVIKK